MCPLLLLLFIDRLKKCVFASNNVFGPQDEEEGLREIIPQRGTAGTPAGSDIFGKAVENSNATLYELTTAHRM